MSDFTETQRKVLERVEKLLKLAGKNTNEAEAQSATEKAMALLEEHNLTMGEVEREGGGAGKRAEEKYVGGFYQWERDLWHQIAHLNFCWYWHSWGYERTGKNPEFAEAAGIDRRKRKKVWRHTLIGRKVNIAATRIMAEYLMQVINRLTKERLRNDNTQLLSRWATSFREGMSDRIRERLEDRREKLLEAEREKERAAAKMAMDGASTATGLTLGTVEEQEHAGNYDHVYGEGAYARKKAAELEQRAQEAMFSRMSEDEYTRWAADHPEQAAERAARERRANRRRSSSGSASTKETDWSAYKAGYAEGDRVSLDQQTGETKIAGRLK